MKNFPHKLNYDKNESLVKQSTKFFIDKFNCLIKSLEINIPFKNSVSSACHFFVVCPKSPYLNHFPFLHLLFILNIWNYDIN